MNFDLRLIQKCTVHLQILLISLNRHLFSGALSSLAYKIIGFLYNIKKVESCGSYTVSLCQTGIHESSLFVKVKNTFDEIAGEVQVRSCQKEKEISLVQFMKQNFILKQYSLSSKVILHIDFNKIDVCHGITYC